MGMIRRVCRGLMIVVLPFTIGVVPSCASMGGGGMKLVAPDPIPLEQSL
jgi:hypothetical protein